MPDFRGKGRLTMSIDRRLTDYADPASYLAVATIQGAKMQMDLRQFSERFVFYYRAYETELISMFRKLYKGGNFLDIGSNMGQYVVSMAPFVRKAGARIFSVEPVAVNLARQTTNVELNGCADLVEYATEVLGDSEGTVYMTGQFESSSVNALVAKDGTHPFPLTTLDRLAEERGWRGIGAVKIDVEGYEPAVLRGGMQLFARERPLLLAEFNRERMAINGFDMSESWRMLQELGYRGHAAVGGELQELSEPGDVENIFFLP
jgi:FkbM family methyltransferase